MRRVTWCELALRGLRWTTAGSDPPALARERSALAGLEGVRLTVHLPEDLAERDGSGRMVTQRSAERRLREAGIPLLGAEEWVQRPGRPELHLTLRLVRHPLGVCVLSADLELVQDVRLEVDPSRRVRAVTWTATRGPGLVGEYALRGALDEVDRLLASFVEHYRAINTSR